MGLFNGLHLRFDKKTAFLPQKAQRGKKTKKLLKWLGPPEHTHGTPLPQHVTKVTVGGLCPSMRGLCKATAGGSCPSIRGLCKATVGGLCPSIRGLYKATVGGLCSFIRGLCLQWLRVTRASAPPCSLRS